MRERRICLARGSRMLYLRTYARLVGAADRHRAGFPAMDVYVLASSTRRIAMTSVLTVLDGAKRHAARRMNQSIVRESVIWT